MILNLKKIRLSRSMTQEQLASKVGITQSNLSRIENGDVQISLKLAKALSEALNCTMDELIGEPKEEEG